MIYKIEELNRNVELDDEIAREYQKYKRLRDGLFMIALFFQYDKIPENISDEELSSVCNKAILKDMEVMTDNAKIVDFLQKNKDKMELLNHNEECVELTIKEDQSFFNS